MDAGLPVSMALNMAVRAETGKRQHARLLPHFPMDAPASPTPDLLLVHRALTDGFAVEARVYEPSGSYTDWVLSPLADGRYSLSGTPVEVWDDAGSVGTANYPGKTEEHFSEGAGLLATLGKLLGPNPYVRVPPPPLHQPADPRVRFTHRMGNFTLDLQEGSTGQGCIIIPGVFLLLVVMGLFISIPFLNGWRHWAWLYFLFGLGGLALFGRFLIPILVDTLGGHVVLKVDGLYATITRGRSWWRREQRFRWADVESLEIIRRRHVKFGWASTAQFVLRDGSRVDYATLMIQRPWEEAVAVLQSVLAARAKLEAQR